MYFSVHKEIQTQNLQRQCVILNAPLVPIYCNNIEQDSCDPGSQNQSQVARVYNNTLYRSKLPFFFKCQKSLGY